MRKIEAIAQVIELKWGCPGGTVSLTLFHRRHLSSVAFSYSNLELKVLADSRFPKELKDWLKSKKQFDAKNLDLFTYLGRTMPLLGKHGAEKGRKNPRGFISCESGPEKEIQKIISPAQRFQIVNSPRSSISRNVPPLICVTQKAIGR